MPAIQGMNAVQDNKGLTLVEVLIAMLVLLFVSLAMMQTALVSIDANMRNVLRDEAVSIAEMRMNEARNIPFATLDSDPAITAVTLGACTADLNYPVLIERNVRNIAGFDFGSRRTVVPVGTDDRQITILVRWVYRNECYTHSISTIVRRQ